MQIKKFIGFFNWKKKKDIITGLFRAKQKALIVES